MGRLSTAVIIILLLGTATDAARSDGAFTSKRITQYSLDSWTDVRGLRHNSIIAIRRTDDGYLWLATYARLYRFDGVEFLPVPSIDAPRSLATDSRGRLWIGTADGVHLYYKGTFERLPADSSFRRRVIHSIIERSDGTMLFGTAGGVLSYDGARVEDRSFELDAVGRIVYCITETADGELWLGTDRGARRVTTSFTETIDTTTGSLRHSVVRSIMEDRYGYVWIGTAGGGVTRFREGHFSFFSVHDGLPSNVVRVLYEDRNGSVWIGTSGGGLSRYRNGRFETLGSADGLTTDVVWALHQDPEGSLWIGTGGGGLNRLRDTRILTLTKREGLGNNFLWTVFQDSRGRQWLGTNGSGVTVWDNGIARTLTVANDPLSNIVRSVAEDREGRMWVGTLSGLYRSGVSGEGGFRRVASVRSSSVTALMLLPDGAMWAGTSDSGAYLLRGGTVHRFTRSNGLPDNAVRSAALQPDGSLWLGTDGGIAVVRAPVHSAHIAEPWERNAELAAGEVRDIMVGADSTVWIGTDARGLFRYRSGRLTRYSAEQGYDAAAVHDVQEDGLGFLWLSCNKGVFRVSAAELAEVAEGRASTASFRLFGTADGMGSSEANGGGQPAGFRMKNGTIWFPTMKGAAIIAPSSLPTNTIVPPVYLHAFTADGRTLTTEEGGVTVPAGTNRLTVSFSALSLLVPERVRFQYMLEGYDGGWTDGGSERTASYTNVPPGTYTFRVIGCNNDGLWNTEGASMTVTVRPFVYQTWAFILAVTVLAAGGAAGIYRYRIAALRRRAAELERDVEERTRHLQVEKERAERANSDKGELMHVVAHDLKNPLTSIYGMANMMHQDELDAETMRFSTAAILHSSEYMMNLIEDLLNVEAMESGRITLKRTPVDLAALAGYVTAMTGQRAEQKGQRITLDLCRGDDAMVLGDTERLFQAMENYISNAVKYSPHGSVIEVSVQRAGAMVRFAVLDHGQGIPEEDQPKLFRKFQKLTPRPTGDESSTGLGLSIVKLLVEQHGGSVGAVSAPDIGSTFFFDLPYHTGR